MRDRKGVLCGLAAALATSLAASQATQHWPTDTRLSGNAFLTPSLNALQQEAETSPISLWLDKGQALWSQSSQGVSCQGCHGAVDRLKTAATQFPKIAPNSLRLINLEDQIIQCRSRAGQTATPLESEEVLALSALLHNAAKGLTLDVKAPAEKEATAKASWQQHLSNGTRQYATRIGRINLACVHCHDQGIGKQMRADVISPGNPTGFPIYRMSWQTLGSIDRRLRACYSGVQAQVPPAGDLVLRELELYLKVRAQGLPIDGPSVRR